MYKILNCKSSIFMSGYDTHKLITSRMHTWIRSIQWDDVFFRYCTRQLDLKCTIPFRYRRCLVTHRIRWESSFNFLDLNSLDLKCNPVYWTNFVHQNRFSQNLCTQYDLHILIKFSHPLIHFLYSNCIQIKQCLMFIRLILWYQSLVFKNLIQLLNVRFSTYMY